MFTQHFRSLKDAFNRVLRKQSFKIIFFGLVQRLPPSFANHIVAKFYDRVNWQVADEASEFTNYGYATISSHAPGAGQASEAQKYDYLSRQLYHKIAGTIDLSGKDVLEVGCGRGGGAAFVRKCLGPRSVTGIDLSQKAIDFCARHYQIEGLSFKQGAAENIPFPKGSFDVAINVESSHTYPSMKSFLGEVTRVLRPGGCFLFTDFRPRELVATLREQFEQARLNIVVEENITANVLRALDLTSAVKAEFVKSLRLRRQRSFIGNFAAVKGSQMYESFRRGELEYWYFVLQCDDGSKAV